MENIQIPNSNMFVPVLQFYLGKEKEPVVIGSLWQKKFREVLEDILTQRDLLIRWETADELGATVKRPALIGEDYEVVGMGFCQKVRRRYYFYGNSAVEYNKGINKDHLKQIKDKNPDFDYEVLDDIVD